MGDNEMVCQLPGCRVTQKDVETALAEYLEGYCMVSQISNLCYTEYMSRYFNHLLFSIFVQKCARKRDGSLCGCPFPCSLTFKGNIFHTLYIKYFMSLVDKY